MMSTTAAAASSQGGKPLATIPVVLTILATILAGLSSSEMTRSMYFRSLAGQHQAKAASQWGFFQAKKMRGTTLEAADNMTMLFFVKPFDENIALGLRQSLNQLPPDKNSTLVAAIEELRRTLDSEDAKLAIQYVSGAELPTEKPQHEDYMLSEILTAIRTRTPESKTVHLMPGILPFVVESEIERAETSADAFSRACDPIVKSIQSLERAVGRVHRVLAGAADQSNEHKALAGAVHGAALSLRFGSQDFTARRYDREAHFNQQIGELYEVQVRQAGFESERHRIRSRNFFYAMLCAQAGVTLASFALAKTRQSAFWLIAGLAGLIALGLGAYVYLAM
jgi:Domain of unknown function (DUF4337)